MLAAQSLPPEAIAGVLRVRWHASNRPGGTGWSWPCHTWYDRWYAPRRCTDSNLPVLVELRDGGERYAGRGVSIAVANVVGPFADTVRGRDATDQADIDAALRRADGTPGLSALGANAALAISVANVKAATCDRRLSAGRGRPSRHQLRRRPDGAVGSDDEPTGELPGSRTSRLRGRQLPSGNLALTFPEPGEIATDAQ
ncbi:hypothetical protein ACWDTI_23930 [Gordonia sp. NPDC003424]